MQVVREGGAGPDELDVRREVDASQLGRAISRRKAWIIAPTLLCAVAATVGVNVVKPRYTAEAKILLENQESFFTRPDRSDQGAQAPLPDDTAVLSQVQLVTSRDIARGAIRTLGLAGNPEFDPAAKGMGPLDRVLVLLGLERNPFDASATDRMLASFYDKLNVYPVPRSRVLSVQFTAHDPDLAAKAANTVADLYIDQQSDAKRDSAKAAATSLATLIADLKVRLAAADTKAQDYRARNGLLMGTNNTTITSQGLSDLTTQLSQARTQEAESDAKAKLLRDMIKQNRITEVPDVANSDLVRRIAEQRVLLKAQIAQQAMTLLPAHPRMRELNAQLSDLDNQMRLAAEKIVRTLENDSKITASRIDNLQAALDTQKQAATTASTDQVTLNELEQQARLLRDQLDFNTQKYQEALARESSLATPADARVISQAVPPELPSFPRKMPIIAIFTLAGLILSIGIVVSRELLSGRAFVGNRVRAVPVPVPVEPTVEVVPAPLPVPVMPAATADAALRDKVAEMPAPVFSADDPDLVTMLDMVAEHQKDGAGVRVLVARGPEVAGEAPQAALMLSRGLARRSRVVLVDCGADEGLDRLLANPRGDDAPPVRGLGNLLAGDTSFAEVIHRDPHSRLHVVPMGAGSLDDLGSAFSTLVDALTGTYDHVVLAGPTLAPDAAIRAADMSDIAILFTTATTEEADLNRERDALHRAGLPSVYVLDVADLAALPERPSVAA